MIETCKINITQTNARGAGSDLIEITGVLTSMIIIPKGSLREIYVALGQSIIIKIEEITWTRAANEPLYLYGEKHPINNYETTVALKGRLLEGKLMDLFAPIELTIISLAQLEDIASGIII